MIDKVAIVSMVLLALTSSVGRAEPIPKPAQTARDIYVGCYLFVRNTDVPKDAEGRAENFGGGMCALMTIGAITYREGRSDDKDNRYRFCLPGTAAASTDPARAMAFAYIDYYEKIGVRSANSDGKISFVVAMIDKWPCPAK